MKECFSIKKHGKKNKPSSCEVNYPQSFCTRSLNLYPTEEKKTIFSAPLYPSCGVSSVLFHNTSYTLQCASAHSTHHIKTPLYPLLEAGIQLRTQCGDGKKAATGWLRLSPSLHTGLKLMNLIPGETQRWKEALNTQLFQQDREKYAALNDWSAAGGCRQDVECGFCFSCCWKLCQAQVT